MEIVVNGVILALICLTGWFFFAKNEASAVEVNQKIRIKVEGGYQPSVLQVQVNKPVTFEFERLDASSCLEEVVLPDFKIKQFLPLNKITPITITPKEKGEFEFHCGMSMFFGKLKVV